MTTDELAELLILARQHVPFVQANLLEVADDDAALVAAWRDGLQAHGVWANDPVPLYPYPSSPDYRRLFGAAGRPGLGARARALPRPVHRASPTSRRTARCRLPELEQACRTG